MRAARENLDGHDEEVGLVRVKRAQWVPLEGLVEPPEKKRESRSTLPATSST